MYRIKNKIKKWIYKGDALYTLVILYHMVVRRDEKNYFVKPETREIVFVKPANEGEEGDVLQPAEAFLPPPSRESTV